MINCRRHADTERVRERRRREKEGCEREWVGGTQRRLWLWRLMQLLLRSRLAFAVSNRERKRGVRGSLSARHWAACLPFFLSPLTPLSLSRSVTAVHLYERVPPA